MVYVKFDPKIDVLSFEKRYAYIVRLSNSELYSEKIGSRKLNKCIKNMINKILVVLTLVVGFNTCAFASDNVLQAIQIDGVKDSYNIILKSDDVAEMKKTVQAPNKMMINLNGIRASKTINTIYNNTSSVDSVVVEPNGDESVKILIQGENVANAQIHFDTLKTPLGVLDKTQATKKSSDEIVLSAPMQTFKPVYEESEQEDNSVTLSSILASPSAKHIKNILKNEKLSWMITFGLMTIFILGSIKSIKGKDNDIKVGLSQSLKQRELELYKEGLSLAAQTVSHTPMRHMGHELPKTPVGVKPSIAAQHTAGAYGLRAYQNGTKNPYTTPEIQRPRPVSAQSVAQTKQKVASAIATAAKPSMSSVQNTQRPTLHAKQKVSNIDSIKFLESMTRIYEKNGRSDLAQGLKSNMKKANISLA